MVEERKIVDESRTEGLLSRSLFLTGIFGLSRLVLQLLHVVNAYWSYFKALIYDYQNFRRTTLLHIRKWRPFLATQDQLVMKQIH